MHEDFVATVYPQVHESLKHTDDEHVHLENPLSSIGTLTSIKNLDNFNFMDQFFNDKPTEEEPDNANVEIEVDSMVTVPIYQASSSAPPLSTPVIIVSSLYPINQTVNEVIKEVVQIALQAPLRECFRDMSEAKMKEILHQRMFESGTYQSQPEHVALYEALEASMESDNKDKFLAKKDKSRKRPPQSSAWKTFDTREAPSSFSKQKFVPHSEQPVEEVPIPDDVNISDSEDTNTAHLPKIKTRPDWLNPVLEEGRPETPKPDWFIPLNDLPEPENNWANAFSNSKSKLSKASLEGPTYKIDLVNPEGNRLVPDVGKPLPLGGPPGQVTIQPQFFFNKDLEYLVSGSQERRNALSISKLKAAYYPDFGLEEIVPSL
ncbi:hypothetical protein Tco_0299703 [Tanacetum coccineum]